MSWSYYEFKAFFEMYIKYPDISEYIKQYLNLKNYYKVSELPELLQKFEDFITNEVKKFNKDELFYLSCIIKEICYYGSYTPEYYKYYNKEIEYRIYSLIDVCTSLQNILINLKYENYGYLYIESFIKILVYFEKYTILYSNIELFLKLEQDISVSININDLFSPVDDTKISGFDKYLDEYYDYSGKIKLEEETINDVETNIFLKKVKNKCHISTEDILAQINNYLLQNIGFNIDDLELISAYLLAIFKLNNKPGEEKFNLFRIEVLDYQDINNFFKDKSKYLSEDKITKIINFFMMDDKANNGSYKNIRNNELNCIIEIKNKRFFGIYNFLNNVLVFKGLAFHIINYIEENSKLRIYKFDKFFDKKDDRKFFSDIQKKLATFMSYKIADILNDNGYIVPRVIYKEENINKEKEFWVEIEKIEIPKEYRTNKKSFIEFSDIDVIALDKENKVLLHIEAKDLKPTIEYSEIGKKNYEKQKNFIEVRYKTLKDNKAAILKALFNIDEDDYDIKNIYITNKSNKKKVKDEYSNMTVINYEQFKQNIKKLSNL
ncbi:hypothetical protein [uncultured Tyzzerella sp.]|uniref:hypothetical protein n=1 Tax=uncultured Tyzzerella sp. TaxID=2321398 RepID=UPI00294366FB|nr:hypothetical protein [uncultured Tyzzerella sp.]